MLDLGFYPVLTCLDQRTEARRRERDLPAQEKLLAKLSSLEVHHISRGLPQLYKVGYQQIRVNAWETFLLSTKTEPLISDRRRRVFRGVEGGPFLAALRSQQWCLKDPATWKLKNNFRDF